MSMPIPHLPPQPPLNSQERQAAFDAAQFIARARQSFAASEGTMELRKWSVEQAVRVVSAVAWQDHDKAIAGLRDCMSAIYDFASEPLTATLDELDPKN
jgi:hypothetical protein